MKVVVVGQGYVGLPLAMRAVEVGHVVVGLEIDETKVKRLEAGESYVEDVSSAQLQSALSTSRYIASGEARSCTGFDVGVITVPTRLREGNPDLSFIEQAAHALSRFLRPGAMVVLESTTYPGTTEELLGPILEKGSGLTAGVDFYLGYQPRANRSREPGLGLRKHAQGCLGYRQDSLARVKGFYNGLIDQTVAVSSPKEAELTKLLENTFRHVNIALVNELAMFAADLGIDVREAIDAASTKPFGFMPFAPGPGVGVHCLPIDPSYLSWRVKRRLGYSFRFVELANDVNDHMPDYIVRRLMLVFNRKKRAVNGSLVLLLGLAYKKNTGDARESPSQTIVERLLSLGAEVRAADPHIFEASVDKQVKLVDLTVSEVQAADAVVLLTDHDAFDLQIVAEHAAYVLDTRNRVSGPAVEKL
jgi:UDP-N-acetyl-D-glucosamine dehydrogenase